jgi:hypothetical protein
MITNQTLSFFNVFNLALTYRRATPLLERCRELAGRRGARGAAARAVPGRDQRHAGIGVAAVERGLEDGAAQPRRLSLFPGDRCEGLLADASIVRVKLSELQLRRPRQWGACWLGCRCGASCQLDQLWPKRLGVSRNAWAPLRAKTSAGDDEFRRSERRDRGFADSSLEGDGFEPSVPRRGQYFSRPPRSSVRGPPFRERGDRSRRKGKAVPWRVTSIVRAFDRHQAAGLALIGRSHARPVALL